MSEFDDTDLRILALMRHNARLSASEIGKRIGLSQSAAWRRLRRLIDAGVIKSRHAVLNREALGYSVTVFLGVKLSVKARVSMEDFERAVSAIPEVQLVQHVLGLYDYRLKVVARDLSDFERILRRRLMTLPGVGQIESNVVLSEEQKGLPFS